LLDFSGINSSNFSFNMVFSENVSLFDIPDTPIPIKTTTHKANAAKTPRQEAKNVGKNDFIGYILILLILL
jgi:hypothetical protein